LRNQQVVSFSRNSPHFAE